MTDLIQQAEALEQQAIAADNEARNKSSDAAAYRIQATKLREQAVREPLRLWVNYGGDIDAIVYESEQEAKKWADKRRTRIAVPMAEVRPGYALVKVPTDREIFNAMHMAPGSLVNTQFCRAFANALGLRDSLAGVGVEK